MLKRFSIILIIALAICSLAQSPAAAGIKRRLAKKRAGPKA